MIQRLSVPQVHEVVQLGFLAGLTQRVSARRYILKDGANLRMFFGSPRSSEDMDFDAIDIPDWQLADGVDSAVRLPVVERILRANGLTIVRVNSQKQTLTTQRWTIEVTAPGHRLPVSTTGEFSHRASVAGQKDRARAGSSAEQVSAAIAGRYASPPIILPHYLPTAAILQKIAALALRTINQPRDVFDLDLLVARFPAEAPHAADVESGMAERAAERATEFDFDAFRDSVLPFIDDPERPFYETPAVWSDMQDRVATYLLGLAQ